MAKRLLVLLVFFLIGTAAACDRNTNPGPDPIEQPPPSTPPARRHAGIAYDNARGRVLLFGGVDNANQTLDDLWSWDGATWTRLAATTGGHEIGTELYGTPTDVFTVSPTGRVQRLSGTTWVNVNTSTTPSRPGAAYGYDSARGRLVRFGGGDPGQGARETWEFDGQSWTLASTDGPSRRLFPAMAYDPQRRVTVLFGGLSATSDQKLDDTWEWDGFTWTQAGGPAPPGLFGSAMVFDGGGLLLFGGIDATTRHTDELWRRSNGAWNRVTTSGGPSPRSLALMAFDAARSQVLLFGGDAGVASLGDTWTWSGSAWVSR